jgi:hypothetical protein
MSIAEVADDSKDNPQSSTNTPKLGPIACHRCAVMDVPTVMRGTGPHAYRAQCRHCGAFLKWISPLSHEERVHRREQYRQRAMKQLAPTAPQLAFLRALGDTQAPPADRLEASQRIAVLTQGKGVV